MSDPKDMPSQSPWAPPTAVVAPQLPPNYLASPPPNTPAKPGNGFGFAALILSICAIVGSAIPGLNYLAPIVAIVGIVLGIFGLVAKNKPRKAALSGTIISTIAFVLSIVLAIVYTSAIIRALDFRAGAPQPGASAGSDGSQIYDDKYGAYGNDDGLTPSQGDDDISIPEGIDAGIISVTASGTGSFRMEALDSNGKQARSPLVDATGNYSGVVAWGLSDVPSKHVNVIRIITAEPWTIDIESISTARQATLPLAGHGDAVFRYDGPKAKLAITNTGKGPFTVTQIGVVNSDIDVKKVDIDTVGDYSGSTTLTSGPSVIIIKSDGDWTLK